MASYERKNRVRDGGRRVQRRKKVASQDGYTYDSDSNRSRKMSASDRRKMSRSSRRSARKARSKRSLAQIKRDRSNRRRSSLGFD